MSPLNRKKIFKHLNIKRKVERKKWRDETIKAALDSKNGLGLQQDVNNVDDLKEDALLNFNYVDSKPSDNLSVNQETSHKTTVSITVPGSILETAQSHELDDLKEDALSNFNYGDSKLSDHLSVNQETPHKPTVSIAVPGSILENAQSHELKTFLVGSIARAACLYCVDEIVVFDDLGAQNTKVNGDFRSGEESCKQFIQFLQYMECPQYLRKHLFPLNKELKCAALLLPLDAPHHLQYSNNLPFREGVVSHHLLKNGKGCYVNVGFPRDVCVQKPLVPGTRVTVHLRPKETSRKRYGEVVSRSLPRQLTGVYWGYSVRSASSLIEVFMKAPYQEGYDLTLGTSDKGTAITNCVDSDFQGFKHVLIVFGGVDGLESALEYDENLNIDNVALLFDKYLNTCPNSGLRTVRTEEAVLISLALIVPRLVTHD